MAPTKSTGTTKKAADESPVDPDGPAVKTGIAADPGTQGLVTSEADHDRVVMASRHPDGSPAQTDAFEYIGDKDVAVAAAKTQLGQQAVSAADVAIRGVSTETAVPGEVGSSAPDPAVAEIKAVHDSVEADAHDRAEAEVESHHHGLERK